MSGLVAVLRRDGSDARRSVLDGCLDRIDHRGPDARGLWRDGPAGLGGCTLVTTPWDRRVDPPTVGEDGRLAVVAHARIDNRAELADALPEGVDRASTDESLILAAYREWGLDCPRRLVGAFAFALWDARRGRLFCARDHIGIRPLYVHRSPSVAVVGSEPKALLAHPAVDVGIDERRLGEYLVGAFEDRRRTFHEAVRRLPPAHSLTVPAAPGEATLRRYWSLDPARTVELGSEAAYADRFRDLFDEAVRCRLPTPVRAPAAGTDPGSEWGPDPGSAPRSDPGSTSRSDPGSTSRSDPGAASGSPSGPGPRGVPAAMLSGGLDSSAVVCTARAHLDRPVPTYTLVFDTVPAADEREYAAAVVEGGGVDPTYLRGDEERPFEGLDRAVWANDGPSVFPNYFLTRAVYRAAADAGHRAVLSGFDGDTTLSHGQHRLADLLTRGRVLRAARELDGYARAFGAARRRLLWTQVAIPLAPRPVARLYHRLRSDHPPWWSDPVVDPAFADRVGLDERRETADRAVPDGLARARRHHYRELTGPVLAAVLEYEDALGLSAGVQPRYPFFDRRLVEFCLALPPGQKVRRGRTRGVLRRGLADRLPAAVRDRGGKADASPNFLARLREGAGGALDRPLADSSAVAEYVDRSALERARRRCLDAGGRDDGDGPAGSGAPTKLWRAVTAEAWLRSREDGAVPSGAGGEGTADADRAAGEPPESDE